MVSGSGIELQLTLADLGDSFTKETQGTKRVIHLASDFQSVPGSPGLFCV